MDDNDTRSVVKLFVQTELVYLNYGTWDDFESVTSSQVLEGRVAVARSGVISLEHKVTQLLL